MNFIHKWLNPHCPDCKEEAQDATINIAIETLKSELAAERYNNQLLINALLPKPESERINQIEIPQEINKRNLPWRVRQQMLEAEDRAKAHTMRQIKEEEKKAKESAAKTTEELEKELLEGE